jgi:serine/threonine protein kinase
MMRHVRHSRIVELYGLVNSSTAQCIVMEYLEQGSLSAYIKGNDAISWDKKIGICLDTALGISYLHKVRIIHRDLKCSNVVLDKHLRAKICDFGMAVARTDTTTMIETHQQGTVQYMVTGSINL